MTFIKLLLADDHILFREGVRAILNSAPDIEIVGEAGSGPEVVALSAKLNPDIILMDIQMPGMNGVEATRLILDQQPDVGIIIVTMLEDDDSLFSAMQAGARGYILKGADKTEMLKCIHAVYQGEVLFGPSIAARMLNFFQESKPDIKKKVISEAFPDLTERELEILIYIARGNTNSEIADKLVISLKTVQNHVTNIFNKLQVADRVQAVIKARNAGVGI